MASKIGKFCLEEWRKNFPYNNKKLDIDTLLFGKIHCVGNLLNKAPNFLSFVAIIVSELLIGYIKLINDLDLLLKEHFPQMPFHQ